MRGRLSFSPLASRTALPVLWSIIHNRMLLLLMVSTVVASPAWGKLNKPTLTLTTGQAIGVGCVWVSGENNPSNPPGYGGCLLVRSTELISWNPADGQYYVEGQNVDASPAIIIYSQYALPDSNHPVQAGLAPCKTLYYKLWVRDVNYVWSDGDQKSCIPYGPCPAIDDPLNVHAVPGTNRAKLTWENPIDPDYASTMIVRFTSINPENPWRPTDGVTYQVGQGVDGGVVAYNYQGTTFVDTGLTNLQKYWYRVFAVTTDNNYSWGVSISATPAKEPTSHYYEFVRQWGSPGLQPGQFDSGWGPRGITVVERDGQEPEVHVSDPGDPTVTSTHRVQAFKTTGEFLRSSPTAGAGYFWVHDLEYSSYVERVMAFGRLADKYRAFGELFIIELSIGLSWYQHLLTSA